MKILWAGLTALLVAALMLGCGGSSDSEGSATGTGATTTKEYTRTAADAPEDPNEVAHAEDWDALKRQAGPLADRLLIPNGPHPKRVVIRELRPGKGEMIEPGDTFGAKYVSYVFSTGEEYERVWRKGPPSLIWDIEEVVDGWWPGLRGMREGGMRELILPASWAYGNSALVYLVELVEVEHH